MSSHAIAAPDRDAVASDPSRRRRRLCLIAVGLVAVAAATTFVLSYFQPQKLFIDDHVDEAFPTAAPPTRTAVSDSTAPTTIPSAPSEIRVAIQPDPPPAPSPTSPAGGPVAESGGRFVSREHGTSGTATIYRFDDGRRVLRFEDFRTTNGPALFVYLSTNSAHGPEAAFDDSYLDLGRLKGNVGPQNYEIPPEADLADFKSVVIWCDRFDVVFGAADLV